MKNDSRVGVVPEFVRNKEILRRALVPKKSGMSTCGEWRRKEAEQVERGRPGRSWEQELDTEMAGRGLGPDDWMDRE